MADGKYGRLFTERDAALLVGVAYSVGWRDGARYVEQGFRASRAPTGRDELLAHVLERTARDHAMTFPADEPLFLLRGQDEAATSGVHAYLHRLAELPRVGMAHIHAVNVALSRLSKWQLANPDRVKVPD